MENLKTGELARRAGVNVETLRFYEHKGLLPKPPRRASGYREYPATLVGRSFRETRPGDPRSAQPPERWVIPGPACSTGCPGARG
jgi:hypothetical protein